MQEIPFSVPVSGIIRIDSSSITITINRSDTIISFGPQTSVDNRRISLEIGKTTYDVIFEAARELIRRNGYNRFSAPELYETALEKYPKLKRNSFMSRVIASAPNHPSYKHYASRRDFFIHMIKGIYRLDEKYLEKAEDETKSPQETKLNNGRE